MNNFAAAMTTNRLEKQKWVLKFVVIFLLSHFSILVSLHGQTMREAFTAMPDSLMPTLTKNNRLDLMDFMDARMKAAVTNKLDGETLMTYFSSDSLCVKLSDALTVEMQLQRADTTAVVCFKRVYTTLSGERQAVLTRYAARTWEELSPATVVESTLMRIDEKIIIPNSPKS